MNVNRAGGDKDDEDERDDRLDAEEQLGPQASGIASVGLNAVVLVRETKR